MQDNQKTEKSERQQNMRALVRREARLLEAELIARIIPSRPYIPLALMIILAVLGMIGGYVIMTPLGILLGQQIYITSIGQQATLSTVNATAAGMVGKTGAAAASSVPGSFAVYGMIAGGISGAIVGYILGISFEVESAFNRFRNLIMAVVMNKAIDEVETEG
ncbi:MAG: hypothetical protein [aquatic viral metagenome]